MVNWISARALLAISIIHNLPTRSIDFFQPFPQADLDVDVFMELPFGFEYENMNRAYILKLNRSSYVINQSPANWFATLKKGFEDKEYEQSDIALCVFYRKDYIILYYIDDYIIIDKKDYIIKGIVNSIMNGKETHEMTDEGNIESYLGVKVEKQSDQK